MPKSDEEKVKNFLLDILSKNFLLEVRQTKVIEVLIRTQVLKRIYS